MSNLGPPARALERALRFLVRRIADLEPRLDGGDAATLSAYVETVKALATVVPNLAPERRGALLTTAETTERLHLSLKTLLKRNARRVPRRRLELDEVLQRLRKVRRSLSIRSTDDGQVLLHCFAGRAFENIIDVLGLKRPLP